MKRVLLLSCLAFPALLSAQLDKIRPGMPLEEFRAAFPSAARDYSAMTSYVYGDEVQAGAKGMATYTIAHDTVVSYWFQSQRVDGPCDKYPLPDSSAVSRLLVSARMLQAHYSDVFGAPREAHGQPLLAPAHDENEVNVFYAKWKTPGNEIIVTVHRPGKTEEYSAANAYNNPNKEEAASCSYVLEIQCNGKGREVRSEFGNGNSGDEFRRWQPALAPQLRSFPDCWMLKEDNGGKWQFAFVNGKLDGFSFRVYDGVNYGHPTEQAYAAFRERILKMEAEAETQFGKPDSASTKFPEKHKEQKLANYYSIVNYYARWTKGGKTIVLEMDEDGGGKQGEPVFHVEVTCEARK